MITSPPATIIPILLQPNNESAVEDSYGPTEEGTVWSVHGIWLDALSGLYQVDHMGVVEQSICVSLDAASFHALPRMDGQPRHVSIDSAVVCHDDKFVLRVSTLSCLFYHPPFVGHLVVTVHPSGENSCP